MAENVAYEIVTPERLLRSGAAYMVVVPGAEGDFGVLTGHAPLISTIRPGTIVIYPDASMANPERIFIDGGLAEVNPEGLTILAAHAQPVAEFDPAALSADIAAAREELRIAEEGSTAQRLAQARLARLEAMQAVAVN